MEEKKNINKANRIAKIREVYCGGNNTQFAEILGYSTNFCSIMCSGRNKIGQKTLDNILAKFTSVSPCWLYFGEGEMTREKNDIRRTKQDIQEQIITNNDEIGKEIKRLIAVTQQQAQIIAQQTSQIGILIDLLRQK